MLKLSDYAKKYHVTYRTAWNRYKKGLIKGAFMSGDGHIYINDSVDNKNKNVAIYSRVSSNEMKDNLKRQSERLVDFAISNGYQIKYNISEIGSGMNDNRKKLTSLLNKDDWDILIVENKDRLTRFGFNYIETLLKKENKTILVVNKVDDDKVDLMNDLISIIYSFSARIYGLRKIKNKKEIIKFLDK